ncbi:hypothetical protein [Clostridium culturomicium]|uniref:hypothetical protein n=1 Tax=Clostridium culturomicium TaxID=1499683 RepID=UPI0012E05959|nr:hypothetical protein [Clostridium culturomicium]
MKWHVSRLQEYEKVGCINGVCVVFTEELNGLCEGSGERADMERFQIQRLILQCPFKS